MRSALWGYLFAAILALAPSAVRSDEFPIFDGRTYNGKYYPRVDIIEWSDHPGDLTYMDFHIYSKKDPLQLAFQIDASTGKKVMQVNYFFPSRNEHQCRRVLAPQHFTDGFYVYTDGSDPDYDSIVLSMYKMPNKKGRSLVGNPTKYAQCQSDDDTQRLPASTAGDGGLNTSSAASATNNPAGGPNSQARPQGDPGALKQKGQSVPFGNW